MTRRRRTRSPARLRAIRREAALSAWWRAPTPCRSNIPIDMSFRKRTIVHMRTLCCTAARKGTLLPAVRALASTVTRTHDVTETDERG